MELIADVKSNNVVCREQRERLIRSSIPRHRVAPTTKEYQLVGNAEETSRLPPSNPMLFEDESQAFVVPTANFSGQFKSDFIIRLAMKHAADDSDEKEHIFCQSDEKCKTSFRVTEASRKKSSASLFFSFPCSEKSSSSSSVRSQRSTEIIDPQRPDRLERKDALRLGMDVDSSSNQRWSMAFVPNLHQLSWPSKSIPPPSCSEMHRTSSFFRSISTSMISWLKPVTAIIKSSKITHWRRSREREIWSSRLALVGMVSRIPSFTERSFTPV